MVDTRVYTPGYPTVAHCAPQDTIPICTPLYTSGPPESPCAKTDKQTFFTFARQKSIRGRAQEERRRSRREEKKRPEWTENGGFPISSMFGRRHDEDRARARARAAIIRQASNWKEPRMLRQREKQTPRAYLAGVLAAGGVTGTQHSAGHHTMMQVDLLADLLIDDRYRQD